MNERIKNDIKLIPHQAGVYQMRDSLDNIIYIGKAKDLYKRVSQYFLRPQSGKVFSMVSSVDHFTYIVTNTEKEALILEMNMIHEHNPRYNVLLKDNSHYPYIAILKKGNPMLKIARNRKDNKYFYFGPYPNSSAAYEVIDLLNKVFPLRKCRNINTISCIYKDMGMCLAPCVNKIEEKTYLNMINKIKSFLNGNDNSIKENLIKKMEDASKNLDFEKAKEYKDTIDCINKVISRQIVEDKSFKSIDFIGYTIKDNYICISILSYRDSCLLGKINHIIPSFLADEEEIIDLIGQHYQEYEIPKIVAININGISDLKSIIGTEIITSKRGKIYESILLASNNSKIELDKYLLTNKIDDNKIELLDSLGKLLKIKTPYRIDLIDNSHFQGSDAVSGVVSFINGSPYKKLYRKYKINGKGNDDFSSMNEIVKRRYLDNNDGRPGLLLLDGGLPQLRAIKDKYNFPIFGLYKDDKHSTKGIIDIKGNVYLIDKKSSLFFLLTRMQDEVHRFAISFHIKRRSKSMFKSILDDIPNLGFKRRDIINLKYPSIDDLNKASIEELKEILPDDVAINLYKKLH